MFAQRLRYLRTSHNMTQTALAQKMQTTKGTISNYETGHSAPSFDMLLKIAQLFGVSTDFLLGHSDEPLHTERTPLPIFEEHPSFAKWYRSLPFEDPRQLDLLMDLWKVTEKHFDKK